MLILFSSLAWIVVRSFVCSWWIAGFFSCVMPRRPCYMLKRNSRSGFYGDLTHNFTRTVLCMWLTDAQWLLPLKSVVTDVISVERKKHTACSQLKILSSRPQPARENWNRELNGAEQQMSPWEITLVPLKIVFLSLGLKSSLHPFSSTVSLERTKQRFLCLKHC